MQKGNEANYGSTNSQTQLSIQQFNAIGGFSTSSAILPLILIDILHGVERQRGGRKIGVREIPKDVTKTRPDMKHCGKNGWGLD